MILEAALSFTMVTPYLCYSVAYLAPSLFKRFATQDGLVLFSSVLKAICASIYAYFAYTAGFNLQGLIIGIPLMLVGQFLNMVVYQKLGKRRAYYGWELGLTSGAALTGFPWTIGDAQYKGLMMWVLGAWLCIKPDVRFTAFSMLWVCMYFYIIIVENLPSGRGSKIFDK